jgi:peptidoglycan/LPS O-acetylase OafA/YrhL
MQASSGGLVPVGVDTAGRLTVAASPAGHQTADTVDQAGEARAARIEALRALAAVSIALFHLGFASLRGLPVPILLRIHAACYLGLPVFFALSGFLLFRPFIGCHFGRRGPVDLAGYFRNRALRILPLYYAAVVILLLVTAGGGSSTQWLRFSLFAQNYWPDTLLTVDVPMWSLVVEAQFYLLLPALAVGVALLSGRNRGRAAVALALLGAGSWAVRVWAGQPGADPRLGYALPANLGLFIPGMLLALFEESWATRPEWAGLALLRSARAWFLAAIFALVGLTYVGDGRLLVGIVPVLIVGAWVLPFRASAPARALSWRPLALLGVASYSMYIWHWPLLRGLDHLHLLTGFFVVDAVLFVGIASAVAAASYLLIEAPFLRLRQRWQGRRYAGYR